MDLSWDEIRDRAIQFSNEWNKNFDEEKDAKKFLYAFYDVFGIKKNTVAKFEYRIKKHEGHVNYSVLFWKRVLLIETRNKGVNLDIALEQAKEYMPGINMKDQPKYILVTNFDTFNLYNRAEKKQTNFQIMDLEKNVELFNFIFWLQNERWNSKTPEW